MSALPLSRGNDPCPPDDPAAEPMPPDMPSNTAPAIATTIAPAAGLVEAVETWRVRRDSTGVRLEGRVVGGGGPHTVARTLNVSRRCP